MFHVPEKKRITHERIAASGDPNMLRFRRLATAVNEGNFGGFYYKAVSRHFIMIASDGGGWEHVSVSICGANRTPTWDEMCKIKSWFWDEDDCVVQFHPPKSEHVNIHPYVLHLWRQTDTNFPTPPKEFV